MLTHRWERQAAALAESFLLTMYNTQLAEGMALIRTAENPDQKAAGLETVRHYADRADKLTKKILRETK